MAAFFITLYFIAYKVLFIYCGNGAAFNQLRRKNKMEYQEYKTEYSPIDPEHLKKVAADYKSDFKVSKDLYAASDTISEQQALIDQLNLDVANLKTALSKETDFVSKMDDFFGLLLSNVIDKKIEAFSGTLDSKIADAINQEIDLAIDDNSTVSEAVNDIDDLRSQLDGFEIDGDQIAETVRQMISDGDISVRLDVG